ncbi:MAG: S9 family peptidase [Prevotella sp.]|nr:S9 family peptidase [Prevotella sp.]MCM1075114.1 S9 family peptidase [Ruminococcus sp.]
MNKLLTAMSALAITGTFTACQSGLDTKGEVIEKPEVQVIDGKITPEILESFGRISEAVASPDGSLVAFTLAYESIEQNKSNAEIYVMNIDGTNMRRLTKTPGSEGNIRWLDGGKLLAFISTDSETQKPQIFTMTPDAKLVQKISNAENGVQCFEFAPDGKHVVYASNFKPFNQNDELLKDLPKTTGRVVDDLMYKHWDEWVTEVPHPFVAEFDGQQLVNAKDILGEEPYECPMKPFGGAESFAWSKDGKQLVYVCRKLTGQEYAFSTNSNLYLYDLEKGTTEDLTEGIGEGYDTNPQFSPDGTQLAWMSMEEPKYESDQNRLRIMDMATRQVRNVTAEANWDYSVEGFSWAPDGKSIVLNAYYQGTEPIFRVNLNNPQFNIIAEGVWDYEHVQALSDGKVLALRHSMSRPNEICMVGADKQVIDITSVNAELLSQLKMGKVEKHMVPTTDGKEMCTWVVLPPDFDPNKKYPAILYCQGGPQQAVSQFWSYRWNFQIMASNGYIVICPNRRGLPGFGTEWNHQISKDYPGQNMQDYLSAVDYMREKPYVDRDHIAAIGASYGGFSVYWLAGHHEGRFAALIAHAGIFNMEAQYMETEEMWFADYDMGGAPWDLDNPIAQRTFANSPHKAINNWTAPILVTVGELDYRILASQGMMAFNAAKMRGLEAEMLVFPDENHWILKPQNAILWQRVFFRFLDKYLKPNGAGYNNKQTAKPAPTVDAVAEETPKQPEVETTEPQSENV